MLTAVLWPAMGQAEAKLALVVFLPTPPCRLRSTIFAMGAFLLTREGFHDHLPSVPPDKAHRVGLGQDFGRQRHSLVGRRRAMR